MNLFVVSIKFTARKSLSDKLKNMLEYHEDSEVLDSINEKEYLIKPYFDFGRVGHMRLKVWLKENPISNAFMYHVQVNFLPVVWIILASVALLSTFTFFLLGHVFIAIELFVALFLYLVFKQMIKSQLHQKMLELNNNL